MQEITVFIRSIALYWIFIAWWVMCGVHIYFSVITEFDIFGELDANGVDLPLWMKKIIIFSIYIVCGPIFLAKRLIFKILYTFTPND